MTIDQTAVEISLSAATTEALEQELKDRSEALSRHQARFTQVRDELKRRRETKDEQPVPLTPEQQREAKDEQVKLVDNSLINKVIAMEAEQAKLVVEAEIAKAAQREAEERLALVVKRIPQKREPMTREAAHDLVIRCRNACLAAQYVNIESLAEPASWLIDAVVEASR